MIGQGAGDDRTELGLRHTQVAQSSGKAQALGHGTHRLGYVGGRPAQRLGHAFETALSARRPP